MVSSLDSIYETDDQSEYQRLITVSLKNLERSTFISLHFEINNTYLAITCNYDGFFKSHTDIGAGAFIGSNTALVAPVKVGDGAITGAGSVITTDIPANALAVERNEQMHRDGWAAEYRARKSAEKNKSKKG